jgi:hypothetical protein
MDKLSLYQMQPQCVFLLKCMLHRQQENTLGLHGLGKVAAVAADAASMCCTQHVLMQEAAAMVDVISSPVISYHLMLCADARGSRHGPYAEWIRASQDQGWHPLRATHLRSHRPHPQEVLSRGE